MRISLKRDPSKSSGAKQVFMDGVRQEAFASGIGNATIFWIWPGTFMQRLLETPIARFPKRLLSASEVNLLFHQPLGCEYATWVELSHGVQQVLLRFGFNSNDWKGDWSISEYVNTFTNVVAEKSIGHLRLGKRGKEPSIELNFAVIERDEPLSATIESIAATIRELHNESQRRLDAGSIAIRFEFPETIRHACVQYLVYFSEFLRDMGVEVASRISDTPGEVLFSVTPANPHEALSAIREALNLYLELPGSPVTAVQISDIPAQKLIANVRHLEAQLALAQAVTQAQSATIDALQVSLGYERHARGGIVAGSVMAQDREEVLGGTVAVTRYEGKGFEINLAQVLRKVRKLFRK